MDVLRDIHPDDVPWLARSLETWAGPHAIKGGWMSGLLLPPCRVQHRYAPVVAVWLESATLDNGWRREPDSSQAGVSLYGRLVSE